ncbi:hypothetical protein HMPREF1597_02660 [Escherichia coli 907701]|nr:hypothetical protein HMPREF1597_02660 [Escherichia coli 907701]
MDNKIISFVRENAQHSSLQTWRTTLPDKEGVLLLNYQKYLAILRDIYANSFPW